MKQRLRTRGWAREDASVDADFPGRDELRARIAAATGSEQLAALQREHRERRLAARGVRTSYPVSDPSRGSGRPVLPGGVVLRTATSAMALDGFRGDPILEGILIAWGPAWTSRDRGGQGAHLADVQPDALLGWLARVDPSDVALYFAHDDEREALGRFIAFELSAEGLRASCSISAGDPSTPMLLEAADRGDVAFSAGFKTLRWHEGQLRSGESVQIADQVAIDEGSLTTRPADERCLIQTVRGVRATWLRRQDALERDDSLRTLYGLSR